MPCDSVGVIIGRDRARQLLDARGDRLRRNRDLLLLLGRLGRLPAWASSPPGR